MTMDEYITKFTSLLRYVPYVREEKAKVQRFLSTFPTHMNERIEFVNPRTVEEEIWKERMCYQQSKEKGEVGKIWQPRKGQKNSSKFKGSRSNNLKNYAWSSIFLNKENFPNHPCSVGGVVRLIITKIFLSEGEVK